MIAGKLFERLANDPKRLHRLIFAVYRLAAFEAEVITAESSNIRQDRALRVLDKQAELFREQIAGAVDVATRRSGAVRQKASSTARNTRATLGKTAEVAAAAEQSAVAMREAAQTAAGLIQTINETRGVVDGAARVADRALAEAGSAVDTAETLSNAAEQIGSIVALIRSIAGQTNLLALKATIEAARAGDAGRGFAVVAQEVKSLAGPTAQATDGIALQVSSIQSAVKQALAANGVIRNTVDVKRSAEQIRSAMDDQAHTVAMITSSIDETALSANAVSSIIASVSSATEGAAREIDEVDAAFAAVDDELAKLQDSAISFLEGIAA